MARRYKHVGNHVLVGCNGDGSNFTSNIKLPRKRKKLYKKLLKNNTKLKLSALWN